jgi:predicted  nucleic acid-binding Zn-ribbon protein
MPKHRPPNAVLGTWRPANRPYTRPIELASDSDDNDDMIPANSIAKRELGGDAGVSAEKRRAIVRPSLGGESVGSAGRRESLDSLLGQNTRTTVIRDSVPPPTDISVRATTELEQPLTELDNLNATMDELASQPSDDPQVWTEEKEKMKEYIRRLEGELQQIGGGRGRAKRIKAQIQSQGASNRADIETLRERNAELEEQKRLLDSRVVDLKNKVYDLKSEVSGLTLDIRERERVYKHLVRLTTTAVEQPVPNTNTNTNADVDAIMQENHRLKQTLAKRDKKIQRLLHTRDDLNQQLQDQKAAVEKSQADLHDESFRFKLLQHRSEISNSNLAAVGIKYSNLSATSTPSKPAHRPPPHRARSPKLQSPPGPSTPRLLHRILRPPPSPLCLTTTF